MARYLYILASDIPLENVLNHLLLCLNHSYKIRHTEHHQLTSNVPSTNVVVWLKLPAIQFLLMTASLSLGSTSSRHTHTHFPQLLIFIYITCWLYILCLPFHLPLFIDRKEKLSSLSSSILSSYPSQLAERAIHVVIRILMFWLLK